MKLEDKIKHKKVLFIPMVSMRSRVNNKYNLSADGNINRVLYKIYKAKCNATILLPSFNQIDQNSLLLVKNFIKNNNLNIELCFTDYYGINAFETRRSKFEGIADKYDLLSYDYIVIEPNVLANRFSKPKTKLRNKIIYWCVVSDTVNVKPEFLNGMYKYDEETIKNVFTVFATKNQNKLFKSTNCIIDSELFSPKLFDKKVIFFPFRLTDKGYKAKEIKAVLDKLKEEYNFCVLFTDPNDSGIFECDSCYKKVPKDRDVYTTILKAKPIIIMLENLDDIMHMALFEFKYYGCKVITFKQTNVKIKNTITIKNINDLYKVLPKCLI